MGSLNNLVCEEKNSIREICSLELNELGIMSLFFKEGLVVSLFHDLPFFQNHYLVSLFYGGEPVGDDNGGSSAGKHLNGMLDEFFGMRIHRRGGFIQDED